MQKRSLLLILALAATLPASAASFVSGSWYHIITNSATNASNGASGGSGADAYLDPGATPWSFSLTSSGTLEFVDAQNPGDTIQIFNGATSLGVTPQGSPFNPAVSCGLVPSACLADTSFVRITLNLIANTAYNLQFIAIDSPLQSSSGFFRITGTFANDTQPPPPGGDTNTVPEPTTYALTGIAFIGLALLRNRKC